jgi:hypothetical protein
VNESILMTILSAWQPQWYATQLAPKNAWLTPPSLPTPGARSGVRLKSSFQAVGGDLSDQRYRR